MHILSFLCPPCDLGKTLIEGEADPGVILCIYGRLKGAVFQQTPDSTVSRCGCCHISS